MAGTALKVTRYKVENIDYLYYSCYRLKLAVVEWVGIDGRVFVYRRGPISPHTGEPLDTFFSVASPVDMEEYPAEEPDPAKSYPFFRRREVELDLRSAGLAYETEGIIMRELNVLVAAIDKMAQLQEAGSVWVGPAPPASVSGPGA